MMRKLALLLSLLLVVSASSAQVGMEIDDRRPGRQEIHTGTDTRRSGAGRLLRATTTPNRGANRAENQESIFP